MTVKTTSFLNNALVQLFSDIETKTGVTFKTFNVKEQPSSTNNLINKDQPYMQQYQQKQNTGTVYKYLYDPNLSFDFRFHQRMAALNYEERKDPWVTLVFNTGSITPWTNLLSHKYWDTVESGEDIWECSYRKEKCPINMLLISNNKTYLDSSTEKINMYFDRFINYKYTESFKLPNNTIMQDNQTTGQVVDITPVDLNKYDTTSRGSLISSAYKFDLIYWVTEITNNPIYLLEKIQIDIKIVGDNRPMQIQITQ